MHECKVVIEATTWPCFQSTSYYFSSTLAPQPKMPSTLPTTRCPHQFKHTARKHLSTIN
jgi:hypothetical protein